MSRHISYEQYIGGEICVLSPYQIWINMLRSPDIIIESAESLGCGLSKCISKCISKCTNHRSRVTLNGVIIAIFDKFGKGYKYARIPYAGFNHILSEYMSQLL